MALDEALARLQQIDPQRGRLVELKFFGGLSNEEAAEVLGVSTATVQRQWAGARAWLRHELKGKG
jgi:RNA polymerase sigma factor (sigma-70 family)